MRCCQLYSSHVFDPASVKLFLSISSYFCFSSLKNTHHYFLPILAAYLSRLYSFFISLSCSDLSRYDTDDGTRTLGPHWWRVSKPSPGVPEDLLDYRPKEGWLKGILIKRKSHGKKAWWQTKKLNLYLDSSCFLRWHRSILLPSLSRYLVSPLPHPKFFSVI